MRLIPTSSVLVLILAFAAAAQVPDEIKNAPNQSAYPAADGIVLLEEVEIVLDKDGKVSRRHRAMTRLLRNYVMGSGRCDPRISFDAASQGFEVLRCRTWMRDGTPVDTDGKNGFVEVTPFALEYAVDYTGLREMVLIHTGVEHGATTELEYRIADKAPRGRPFWGEVVLQSDLPIVKQTVIFRVPEGTPLVVQGFHCELKPVKTTADGVDVYTVSRADISSIDLVECGGHEREVLARMIYTTVPSWAEVGTEIDKAVSRSIDSSPAIKARVEALTVGVGTPLDRVYSIHEFVAGKVRNIAWPPADFGFQPRSASRVYESAYGHNLDKAVLLKAMLKEAGISAAVVLASTAGSLAMRAPSPTQLGDVWVAAEIGAQRVWLDPTAPLKKRSGRDLEGRAILKLAGRGSTVKRVPVSPPGTNAAVLTGVCRLGADHRMSGQLRLDLSGNLNPYHRLHGGAGPLDAFAKRIASAVGGARARDRQLRHFDQSLSSVVVMAADGRAILRDPTVIELRLPDFPDPVARRDEYEIYRNRRTTPLFLSGIASETIEVEIELPAGFRVTYLPASVKLENDVGRLETSLERNGLKMIYKKTFVLKKSVVAPADYAAFRPLITEQLERRNTVILLEKVEE